MLGIFHDRDCRPNCSNKMNKTYMVWLCAYHMWTSHSSHISIAPPHTIFIDEVWMRLLGKSWILFNISSWGRIALFLFCKHGKTLNITHICFVVTWFYSYLSKTSYDTWVDNRNVGMSTNELRFGLFYKITL